MILDFVKCANEVKERTWPGDQERAWPEKASRTEIWVVGAQGRGSRVEEMSKLSRAGSRREKIVAGPDLAAKKWRTVANVRCFKSRINSPGQVAQLVREHSNQPKPFREDCQGQGAGASFPRKTKVSGLHRACTQQWGQNAFHVIEG